MLPLRPRLPRGQLRRLPRPHSASSPPRRTLLAAPRPGSGPLMERRADRALPSVATSSFRWLRTLPFFALAMTASALAIFNYQKSSSSVVSSTLYALRTSPRARELLGDEVYFASRIPWIRGPVDQVHGRIEISFWVKGTKGRGLMRFHSERLTRMGYFETIEWSLEPEGGEKISLLQAEGRDPFKREAIEGTAPAAES